MEKYICELKSEIIYIQVYQRVIYIPVLLTHYCVPKHCCVQNLTCPY